MKVKKRAIGQFLEAERTENGYYLSPEGYGRRAIIPAGPYSREGIVELRERLMAAAAELQEMLVLLDED